MIVSKLTRKAQTTIPQEVRTVLQLRNGDSIAYRIEGDSAVITRAQAESAQDPFATFSEWEGETDRRAYGEL